MAVRPELFELHPSSGVPIYRQLIDQVHALIAGSRLVAGDMLPSVREVARAAQVNPMTVSKAYSRLELEGVVERVRGQGMRILEPGTLGPFSERQQEFCNLAAPAIHRAIQLGLTEQQIRETLDQLLEDQAILHEEQLPTDI
ncbi:GntR family transcriptional regulator [Lacipirellula parvula]|uniref:Transcriptional regulator n=1 Tax=Lacipirellula parvula TaxID=2650471 RepID=A0A5K7XHM2_9BACT|nr:GntR family transcriptional regulator [Lacipirellula parvula]BBO36404.1 transcriptional regulator [Lacipirellula parvula]